MNTTEHLEKIKAKCQSLVSIYDNAEPHTPLPAVAGWRSTIAAIEWMHDPACCDADCRGGMPEIANELTRDIIAAWPEELL